MLSLVENTTYIPFSEMIIIIKASPKCKEFVDGIVYFTPDQKEYLQLL